MRHHIGHKAVRASFLSNSLSRISLIAGLLLLFLPFAARADNQVRAVRLSNVVGTVQVLNGADTQFEQAYPNMPLMQGSRLQTGEDGRAEVQFEDGSIARLTPNSSLGLPLLSRDTSGNTNSEIDLQSGLSYIELKSVAGQRFVVRFATNEVTSASPTKFRVNLDANPPELAVMDGTAHVSSGTAYAVDVHANETIRFDASDNTRYFLAQGVDGDSWDQWNADRDQAIGRMAAQETREARLNGNPNDPAWSDLDYYGNWYSNPGGGMFWSPYGAGAGWDPFGSGYWGYYGGGYSWISGYPWGWLPYHCGGWNYFDGFGWGWSPGGCDGGYAPVSTIWSYPAGYKPVPRPLPFSPGRGQHLIDTQHRIISVNRGPEATFIDMKAIHAHPVTAAGVNGHVAMPIAKTVNPKSVFMERPGTATAGRPALGFANGTRPPASSVPVFRPVAPSTLNAHSGAVQASAPRSSAPSFSSGGGNANVSAPMPSSAGHASSGAMPSGGGGGSGGGHVR